MTGKVLTGYRHDLQVTDRGTRLGHALALAFGAALAAVAVLGFGV